MKLKLADPSTEVRRQISTGKIYLLFLSVAAVLFAPLFDQRAVLLANTDNLFAHYPNLIFGYRSLRSGDLGLWNPFLFAGLDFSHVLHHHMLNPVNWILLPFPESVLLRAITVKVLLEISAIGFLAYLSAGTLVADRLTAICCGLAFQLSGFTWFTTTTYIATNLLVALLAYTYVVLTRQQRSWFLNYLFLALCFAAIFFCGHPGYAIAFLLPAPLLVLCSCDIAGKKKWGLLGILALAGITALALASYRMLSVLLNLRETSRVIASFSLPLDAIPGNNGALLLPGLVPGIWGLSIYDGFQILHWLKVKDNLQIHALCHYAVLPLLLVFASLAGKVGRAALGAAAAMAVLVATYYGLIPMAFDLSSVLLGAANHIIIAKVLTASTGAAAVVFACRHLERENVEEDWLRFPLAVCCLIAAASLTMWTKCVGNVPLQGLEPYRPILKILLRLLTAGALLCAAGFWWFWRRISPRMLSNIVLVGFAALAAVVTAFYYRNDLLAGSGLTVQWLVYMISAVVCGAFIIFALRRWRHPHGPRRAWRSLLPAVIAAGVIAALPIPVFHGGRTESVIFAGAMLALGRFLSMAVLGVELLSIAWQVGWRPVLPFVLVFLGTDALLLSRAYDNVGARGFESPLNMYPPLDALQVVSVTGPSSRANLIRNETFSRGPHGLEEWSTGGLDTQIRSEGTGSRSVVIQGNTDSTLYQDVALPKETHRIAFGAWVKSTDSRVGILVTARQTGAEPIGSDVVRHSGSGQWEWLMASVGSGLGLWEARPHLVIGSSEAEMLDPVLVVGGWATPWHSPQGASTVAVAEADMQSEQVTSADLAQFRVNFPQAGIGNPAEPLSNIAMIYGFRTYGGVDSIMDPELERLVTSLVAPNPEWITPFGIRNVITEPRILDLLGVRYDLRGGRNRVRPNALPRFSIFSEFEVARGFDAQLARLKDPSFDYTSEVVLDSSPGWSAGGSTLRHRFEKADYTQFSTSRLRVKAGVQQPSILLFDDSLSPDWHAYRNGHPLAVMRANAHFMAVSLTPGNADVEFRFEPTTFYLLLKVTVTTAALLLAACIWYFVSTRQGMRHLHKSSSAL